MNNMTLKEKRKHDRIDALNLLNYVCFDEDNNYVQQGMGRTLNISESGILLETHVAIDPQLTLILSIGLEDDLVDIKAKVVFSKQNPEGKFESGIEFLEKDETTSLILSEYIKFFETFKSV
jgi:hypothetical protein